MNIIYETTKERGATILIPSTMVDSLNPSTVGLAPAVLANKGLTDPAVGWTKAVSSVGDSPGPRNNTVTEEMPLYDESRVASPS
jgi:hypothetical protein